MRHPPVLLRPSATVPPPPSVTSNASSTVNNVTSSSNTSTSSNITPNGQQNESAHVYANTQTANQQLAGCSSNGGGGGLAFHHASSSSPAAPGSSSGNSSGPTSAFSGSAPSLLLPSARRYVAVRLLTGETLQFDVEVKSKGKELYAAVARHMSSLGMKSTDLFGLAIQIDGEYLFIDPENKLGKYAPKGWKSSHASGLSNAGHPLLVLYFRVKFYVDSHLLIRDRVTREHYYYQLRENVLRHGQPATEESFFRLAALALQAELGDHDPERHRGAYFDTQLYFPQWILERVGVDYVVQNMPAMHRDHRCLSTGSAQLLYIKEASSGQIHYGLHLYRLRNSKKCDDQSQLFNQQAQQLHHLRLLNDRSCDSRLSDRTTSTATTSTTLERPSSKLSKDHKQDDLNESTASNSRTLERVRRPCSSADEQQTHSGTVWLGICGRGIDIYEEEDSFTKTVRATFQWPNIGKLCFERKKFEIRAVGCPESRKFTYYTSSDDKSKHLLYLCRETHQFSMNMQPKLAELKKLEEEANRHYQEALAEGAGVDLSAWCEAGTLRPDRFSLRGFTSLTKSRNGSGQMHGDQRISVISSTSSNTTSGIVSDKVQSVDESEDELDLAGRPIAAPSLESLALVHLRDSCDSLPAELERRNETATKDANSSNSSSTTLPRRLAGLGARLARVGRSSNKTSSNETSRNGSLHSSSSQQSASTMGRSKARNWPNCETTCTASWLRLNSVDVTDGVASLRLNEEDLKDSKSADKAEGAQEAPVEEENQYWYSCDDDVSETGSTNGDKCPGGVLCADCRMGIVRCSGEEETCHRESLPAHQRQLPHHHKGPSESSSLCVSVDHTAQDSTLSDCQSYFHSHVSSVDSSLGSVPLAATEMANTPLAATVSALSSGGSLRSLRSAKVTADDSSTVDYSVQSGPAGSADSSAPAAICASPKLDFTVTSAVPNTGTYPRRSTVSNTLDSDSDYVTLPPLCPRVPEAANSYVFMEPMQPKNGAQVTVANVNQLSLRHNGCKEDSASTTYSTGSQRAPVTSEAAARFISGRPAINILQAHAASASPATPPSFASPAQHLIPPPPYDIRQHPLYNQQQQQQQQSYHPAQIQAQFTDSSHSAGHCCQHVAPSDAYITEPPPPPPPYPIHLHGQVQAPLTTANLGLHLSQQSTSSLVSKHSLNSMASSSRSVEAVSDSQRIVQAPVYDDAASLNDTKTNASSSLYGILTTESDVGAPSSNQPVAPVIGKNNYLDIHATNTLSRRPQQPLPGQQTVQANQTPTSSTSAAPFEQYHLGIPPPPQYPGNSKQNFANVYTNQVTQSQIEQFKAQLYSDVDYVIYPHKDPSLSQQEYLDTKEAASFISSAASSTYSDQQQLMMMADSGAYLPPPPPYRAPSTKSGASIYRSSPSLNANLPPASSTGGIVLSGTTPASQPPLHHLGYGYINGRPASAHYASNQSLSSGNYSSSYSTSNYSSNYSAHVPMAYVPYPSKYLSCQSLASSHSSNPSGAYSASGCYSASTHSLTGSYEPVGAVNQALRCKTLAPPLLSRVHSEESILTYDLPEVTTLSSAIARQEARGCILPPPPPYRKQSLEVAAVSTPATSVSTANLSVQADTAPNQKAMLDIKTLREKSRNLDLPLISALCNDTTLLNQAKRSKLPTPVPNADEQAAAGKTPPQPPPIPTQPKPPVPAPTERPSIQNMPLPPTPIEAAQGKTTGQPPPKPGTNFTVPRHPPSNNQTDSLNRRTLQTVARRTSVQSVTSSRPTSWHVDGNSIDSTNIEKPANQQPPPLPPPNSNSAIEAKLQQLQKAAVAIATGPGSIIAEDGKIAKALNLPAFAKSVKNSYVVSPSRAKQPVAAGLYAVTELNKPSTLGRKMAPAAFPHPANGSVNGAKTTAANGKAFSVVP